MTNVEYFMHAMMALNNNYYNPAENKRTMPVVHENLGPLVKAKGQENSEWWKLLQEEANIKNPIVETIEEIKQSHSR